MDKDVPAATMPSSESVSNTSVEDIGTKSAGTTSKDSPHLTGLKLWLVLGGIGLAIFLFALDVSIIATAIPAITAEFHATTDIGWYAAAYPLALCSLQPIAGKTYANFSLKWTYCSFTSVFLIGSAICGAAPSSNVFIFGRAVCGAGAAGVFNGSITILSAVTPLSKLGLYFAGFTSLFGVATISGPLLGGALTTKVSWRWCFYINLPLGAVTLIALVIFFKPPVRNSDQASLKEKLKKLDLVGCAIFIPAIVMVLLALQWGGHEYAWRSATVVGLLSGASVMAVIFLAWQHHKGDDAMIPFSIVLQRSIFLSCLYAMLFFGTWIGNTYYMPEWFQVIKGASPLHSGVMTLPAVISQVLANLVSGIIVNRTGSYNPWFFFGIGSLAISSGLFTTLTTSTPHAKWITYMVFQGLGGAGMQAPILSVRAQLASRPNDVSVGVSAVSFFQYFGGAVFQSVDLAIFQNKLVKSLKSHAGLDTAEVQILLDAGSGNARNATLASFPQKLDAVLWSYNKAFTNVFYVSLATALAAFVLSFGIEWKSLKDKPTPPKDEIDESIQSEAAEKSEL